MTSKEHPENRFSGAQWKKKVEDRNQELLSRLDRAGHSDLADKLREKMERKPRNKDG